MTKTEELLTLAEAANVFCNKCGYMGKDEPVHKRPSIGDECGYQGTRMLWVGPDDIKQLVELVRLQANTLDGLQHCIDPRMEEAYASVVLDIEQAIEAFNNFERNL